MAPGEPPPKRLFARLSSIGSSAQAAIPGLYAWAITVAPGAWRGGSFAAKIASIVGVIALTTAPLVEGMNTQASSPTRSSETNRLKRNLGEWTGPTWARIWSVWGFALSSAVVWALVPSAMSAARFDGIHGVLGTVGWALFAFASAGPSLRPDPAAEGRIVAGATLKPRSELPRGDILYVVGGVVFVLGLQIIGWGIVVPERAVLVRLVTVAAGVAVLGATTRIALARHSPRITASGRLRLQRALPWGILLVMLMGTGMVVVVTR